MKDKKLKQELPGHADEVFALDWALDGSRVASGGKDKVVKMWVIFTIRILLFFILIDRLHFSTNSILQLISIFSWAY